MARFYGRLRGNRGQATRMGTTASGITVTAETWGSVIRASQFPEYGDHDENVASISVEGKNGGTVLNLVLNADEIVAERGSTDVHNAIGELAKAADALNEAARKAANTRENLKALANGDTPTVEGWLNDE